MILQLIIAAAIALAAFGGGWQVHSWKAGAEEAARLEEMQKKFEELADKQNRAAEELERRLATLRPVYRTITNEVQREIIEKPVYRDCVLPADGVRLVNRAIEAANNPGESDGRLPETPSPAR